MYVKSTYFDFMDQKFRTEILNSMFSDMITLQKKLIHALAVSTDINFMLCNPLEMAFVKYEKEIHGRFQNIIIKLL